MLKHILSFTLIFLWSIYADAKEIDIDTAKAWAQKFVSSTNEQRGRKATENRAIENLTLVYETSDGAGFYVFNISGGGWVITSNDDEAKKVLAYSEQGAFDIESAPEAMKRWLNKYRKEIESVVKNGHKGNMSESRKNLNRKKSGGQYSDIEPLIKTQWNQNEPYNLLCPLIDGKRTPTGCVATAMAQLMYYYQWPIAGIGRKSYDMGENNIKHRIESDLYTHSYKWDLMAPKTDNFTTEEMKEAVAQLMYDAGVAIETIYSPEASSAYTSGIPDAMQKYFSYTKSSYITKESMDEAEWIKNIYSELDAGYPVLYSGMDETINSGHQFICDGYQYKDDNDYFHFNWGWGGVSDGYYTLSAVGDTYHFCTAQDAILFMRPKKINFYTIELDGYKQALNLAGGIESPLPSMSLDGYSFNGWTTERMEAATSAKPDVKVNYTPNNSATLYPVFSYSGKEGNGGSITVFSEDFNTITVGNSTSTSGSSSAWDFNNNIPKGQNVYKAGGAIKLGKGDSYGSITTRTIEAHAGDALTIEFDVKGWTSIECKITVSIEGCNDVHIGYSATMDDDFEHQSVTMTLTKDNPTVTISTTQQRAFIDNLKIYSGGAIQTTYYCTSGTPFTADMKVTSARWGTWYAPFDVEIEEGVRAFIVGTEDGELKMNEITGTIPAHTAVLLYSDNEIDKSLNGLFSCKGNNLEGNMLTGTLTKIEKIAPETEGKTNYVLQNGKDGVMWYQVVYDKENGLYNNVGANRAFLSVPEGTEVKSLASDMELASSIYTTHRIATSKEVYYNLVGQKVGNDYKGIIITGGKKVIKK